MHMVALAQLSRRCALQARPRAHLPLPATDADDEDDDAERRLKGEYTGMRDGELRAAATTAPLRPLLPIPPLPLFAVLARGGLVRSISSRRDCDSELDKEPDWDVEPDPDPDADLERPAVVREMVKVCCCGGLLMQTGARR